MTEYGPLVLFGMLVILGYALDRIEKRLAKIEGLLQRQARPDLYRD